jgi:hypothetical protein
MVWKACLQAVWTALWDMPRKYRYFRECVRRRRNRFSLAALAVMRYRPLASRRCLTREFRARRRKAKAANITPLDFKRWPDDVDSLAYEYGLPGEDE